MIIKELTELFIRDLQRVKKEISLYQNESDLWVLDKEIYNSAGNLVLHLCGNLNHFIGATLGNSGYLREKEFSDKYISLDKLHCNIDETINIVKNCLSNLADSEMNAMFPIDVFKKEMTNRYMLLHLYGHLNYHLGQINYHRRLVDNNE